MHDLRLTVDGYRAAIGRDQPHENLDERALARAVLAAQRSNFPAPKRKRDIFEGGDARIGFAHAPDRQDLLQQPSSRPNLEPAASAAAEGRRQIGARRDSLRICSPCPSRKIISARSDGAIRIGTGVVTMAPNRWTDRRSGVQFELTGLAGLSEIPTPTMRPQLGVTPNENRRAMARLSKARTAGECCAITAAKANTTIMSHGHPSKCFGNLPRDPFSGRYAVT